MDIDILDALCWHLRLNVVDVIAEACNETDSRFIGFGPSLISLRETGDSSTSGMAL